MYYISTTNRSHAHRSHWKTFRSYRSAVAGLLFLMACSSGTEPSLAGDPSLFITNDLENAWVYVVWQDGNAIVGKDSVPPKTANRCIRFTAQPDSAYWSITATETNPNGLEPSTGNVTAPFFNPADRPAWRIVITSQYPSSPAIREQLVDTPC